MKTFFGIKSPFKTEKGEKIYSGQLVEVEGRISKKNITINFNPEYGFEKADYKVLRVLVDIPFWWKIRGTLQFMWWNLT